MEVVEIQEAYLKDVVVKFIQKLNLENLKSSISYVCSKGTNYLGTLYRLVVEGESYILKVPSNSPLLRASFPLNKVYEREVYAYKNILKAMNGFGCFTTPECLQAGCSPMKEYLVLEDMNSKGYEMKDRRFGLDFDHAKIVLKKFAIFHAFCFKMKKSKPGVFREWFQMCDHYDYYLEIDDMYERFLEFGRRKALKVLKNEESIHRLVALGDNLMERLKIAAAKDYEKPFAVICHADGWINNLLFKYQEDKPIDCCFVDWQTFKYASPVIDIAHFICLSTDQKLRRRHLFDLLEFYHLQLEDGLRMLGEDVEEVYPKKAFNEQVKSLMHYGLIVAICMTPMILAEDEDIIEINDFLEDDSHNPSDMKAKNEKSHTRYEMRMNEIVDDFVYFDFI